MTLPGEDFSLAWFEAYLRRRIPGAAALSLEKFTRGTSRQTWFGAYQHAGATHEITLRADHPSGGSDPTPLDQEFFIYHSLGNSGLPVARALWWEDNPSETPRPFYIREKIAGDWNIPHYTNPDEKYDALRIAVAKEHIATLAKVHALDWREAGFATRLAAPASAAEAARNYVETVKTRFAERAREPIPIFYELCEWLVDNAPPAPRISLCKGTNGLGEEVFSNNKLVALSDWEEVSLGDPASDFAFMQGFAEPLLRDGAQIWGMQHALDYYAEITGTKIPLSSVQYYQVIRALNLTILARNSAIVAHEEAGRAFIRQVWTGTEVLNVCKRALAAALGLLPPFGPERFAEMNATVDTL